MILITLCSHLWLYSTAVHVQTRMCMFTSVLLIQLCIKFCQNKLIGCKTSCTVLLPCFPSGQKPVCLCVLCQRMRDFGLTRANPRLSLITSTFVLITHCCAVNQTQVVTGAPLVKRLNVLSRPVTLHYSHSACLWPTNTNMRVLCHS